MSSYDTDTGGPGPEHMIVSVNISITETEDAVLFRFAEPFKFDNIAHLFHTVRDALSSYQHGQFLMIKYAARVSCSNMPGIHDPAKLIMYFDPLIPYRDPVQDLERNTEFRLLKCPSRSNFWRRKMRPAPRANVAEVADTTHAPGHED